MASCRCNGMNPDCCFCGGTGHGEPEASEQSSPSQAIVAPVDLPTTRWLNAPRVPLKGAARRISKPKNRPALTQRAALQSARCIEAGGDPIPGKTWRWTWLGTTSQQLEAAGVVAAAPDSREEGT